MKALSTSTTLVDGRVQVKMPWKEAGPPKRSNSDLALKRMYSAEKLFKKRDCFEIVDEEVQKLVEQGFIIKVPHENVITVNQNGTCHSKPCLIQKRALKSDWCSTPPPKDTMASP